MEARVNCANCAHVLGVYIPVTITKDPTSIGQSSVYSNTFFPNQLIGSGSYGAETICVGT